MYRAFRTIVAVASCVLWWGMVFLLCRLAIWHFQKPPWWTLPGGVAVGFLWHALAVAWTNRRENGGRVDGYAGVTPQLAAGMRSAWKAGSHLRKRARASLFGAAPALPWYLMVQQHDAPGVSLLAADGVTQSDAGEGEEFAWRLGRRALWLELPFAWEHAGGDRWRAFLLQFGRRRAASPVGIVVAVDARRLLEADAGKLRDAAALLRDRLDQARTAAGGHPPVYLLVDRLDSLYGMRSAVSRLEADRLDRPLGCVNTQPGDNASRFVNRCLRKAAEDLSAAVRSETGRAAPAAAVQAPSELQRLEKPLSAFCARVFDNASGPHRPHLRGIFLVSAGAKGQTVPPLLSELPSFRETREAAVPAEPWFLTRLLRDDIPSDAAPAVYAAQRESMSPLVNAGTAGVLAATLAMCWLLTVSFFESKSLLLSAAGRAAPPETAEELAPYFDLADAARLRNEDWRLPRLGMVEAENLADELRRRYADSYFDLKAIPDVERIQDTALAAGRSVDPGFIGNALLLLACARQGIAGTMESGDNATAEHGEFLRSLALSMKLTNPDDLRRLDAYFVWAGRQEWMPAVRDTMAEFEKHIVDKACGGDLRWLPEWINQLPGLEPVDTGAVWEPNCHNGPASARIAPAWTFAGYRIAQRLLASVAYGTGDGTAWREKREAFLAVYRRRAMREWRQAASGLWGDFRNRIADSEVPGMLRLAGGGEDPAMRFTAMLAEHLLPMYDGLPDDAEPGLAWLRLRADLSPARRGDEEGAAEKLRDAAMRLADKVRTLATDDGVAALLSGDRPAQRDKVRQDAVDHWNLFQSALRRATLLAQSPADNMEAVRPHFKETAAASVDLPSLDGDLYARADASSAQVARYLRERSGGEAWELISPRASFDYFRYLATRQAALCLDTQWRETVYNPCLLTPGPNSEKMRRLQGQNGLLTAFLTTTANGFWRWEKGGVACSAWNGLEFPLSPEFLALCGRAAARPFEAPPRLVELPLRVEAVNVDPESLEKPVKVEFALRTEDGESSLAYRNYTQGTTLTWNRDTGVAALLRVHFPSTVATLEFPGEKGALHFAMMFVGESCTIDAEAFPQAGTLKRLGVTQISIRAKMGNVEKLREIVEEPEPTPPASIIRPVAGWGTKTAERSDVPGLF